MTRPLAAAAEWPGRRLGAVLLLAGLLACTSVEKPATRATPPAPAPPVATAGGEASEELIPAASAEPLPPEMAPVVVGGGPAAEPQRPQEPLPPAGPELPATLRVRVGLASDLGAVTLPCCDGDVTLAPGPDGATPPSDALPLVAPLKIEPLASGRPQVWRVQVAALRDEERARTLAEQLSRQYGQPADAHFDAGVDLFRVRFGRYASKELAQAAGRRLPALGGAEPWVVSEAAELTDPALRVTQAGKTFVVSGRWLAVQAAGEGGIRVDGHRYRERVLVYLNDRASLNVINELPLEDYLRGVVPKEMGPEAYPRLEALKAQAVAARTYTLRNLGGFAAEGYDICATPHCQVYGGMDAEHPRSDQAVRDTEGQVLLWQGQPIEALYTATCGGHTEDAAIVFPGKELPYLHGVPCLEAGVSRLAGSGRAAAPLVPTLARALLPGDAERARSVQARIVRLAALAGLPEPVDTLASLDRRELQRFVFSAFDLALDQRLSVPEADLDYLAPLPPRGWTAEDRRRAAYLAKHELLFGPLAQALRGEDIDLLLLRLAELLQVIERREVHFEAASAGRLQVRERDGSRSFAVGASLLTFRQEGERQLAGELALVPGDRLELYLEAGTLLAVVQRVDPRGVAYDRSAKLSSWTRFRTDGELATRVAERYPGLGFQGLEVLQRGRSGRVARLRLLGQAGSEEVQGLAVRWVLDLPETLFSAKRLKPAKGKPGWLFSGRGWGHGVGLCQTGSFGMAGRGASYREILAHYYSGADLARARWRS